MPQAPLAAYRDRIGWNKGPTVVEALDRLEPARPLEAFGGAVDTVDLGTWADARGGRDPLSRRRPARRRGPLTGRGGRRSGGGRLVIQQ
jgi:hypothetical protein